MTYIEKIRLEARARGLSASFEVPESQSTAANKAWQVKCSACKELITVGSAPYPQTKAEHKRLDTHLKTCRRGD